MLPSFHILVYLFFFLHNVLIALFFLICSDVELNPGLDWTCSLNIGHLMCVV